MAKSINKETPVIDKQLIGKKPNKFWPNLRNSPYLFILPYGLLFVLLILLPVIVGFQNYIDLVMGDTVFLQNAVANTLLYGVIVGPIGYMLAFFLAWLISQVTHRMRTLYTVIIYSPSVTGAVMMGMVWRVLFSGDEEGYLNYYLLEWNIINEPIQFLQEPTILFIVMIIIGVWSSMGVGFLAMLSGLLNVDRTLYEAGSIDGIKNRWQEVFYITIPSMKPQMLFGAVMAIVGTFNTAGIAAALSGGSPPPQYSGWLIVDHAQDFGFVRYELGYASAVTVVLLIIVILFNRISYKLFNEK